MIDFWAQVDESDVEKFAKTMILPAYMSHLKIAPFSVSDQVRVETGREPLKIVYLGEGRLEELALAPDACASRLLASLSPGLDVERIRIPTSGAVWTWNEFGPTHPFFASAFFDAKSKASDERGDDAGKIDGGENGGGDNDFGDVDGDRDKNDKSDKNREKGARCEIVRDDERETPNDGEAARDGADRFKTKFVRVYFERKRPFQETKTFPARDAYVSVSRREIFLSWRVVESYAFANAVDLFKKNPSKPTENRVRNAIDRVDFAWNQTFQPFEETFGERRPFATIAPPTSELEIDRGAKLDAETEIDSDVEIDADANADSSRPIDSKFRFELDGRRAMFQLGKIAGSFAVDSTEFLDEALRFAGLARPLDRLRDYVRRVPQTFSPQTDDSGVRVKLSLVEKPKSRDVETND